MEPIVISDETPSDFDPKKFIYPDEYEGHFDHLLISANDIRTRVNEMAKIINTDYKMKRPVLVCTLKGACPFFIHLCDALQRYRQGYDIEFVRASSYDGTESTGNVQMLGELNLKSIHGRHVIVIEDIVDTGATLSSLMPILHDNGKPISAEVCTLLDKRLDDDDNNNNEKKKFKAKYCCFSIPNSFVIGYGLDYNELYRDLQDIFVISQKGIQFDAKKLHV